MGFHVLLPTFQLHEWQFHTVKRKTLPQTIIFMIHSFIVLTVSTKDKFIQINHH